MKENKLIDLSMSLAVNTIELCDTIKGHYSIVNQLERSATSIGANIHEANYAQSKADFISKFQIALKECYETEYWLKLFVEADIVNNENVQNLYKQCGTIRKLLISSINTAKGKLN
ncbi:MAG: four helix bundle protein [Acutalibacteraceae bacterium]|jgi:four helix bundle protein